jgi:LSD1 subclass zinc finger protein
MTSQGCPGRDRSAWTPDDIFEVPCGSCGRPIEFFKDDTERRCGACGAVNPNPRRAGDCASWCASADGCSSGRFLTQD